MINNLLNSLVGRTLRLSRPLSRYLSLIDFGTDTVKAVVIEREESGMRVLGHGFARVEGRSDGLGSGRAAVSSLVGLTEEALVEAEDRTVRDGSQKIVPDDVIFCLPARYTRGKTYTVRLARTEPNQSITDKEMRQARERVERLAREELPHIDQDGVTWRALALGPGVVSVDGHQVTDPLGLKGRALSVSVFGMAVWPSVLRSASAVAERVGLTVLDLVAAPQALSCLAPRPDALMIDVGWQGTSIGLVQRGALVASHWLPMGGDLFTHSLAHTFGCSLEEAEALKRAYSRAELSERDRTLVLRPLNQAMAQWLEAVAEGFSQVAAAQSGATGLSRPALNGENGAGRHQFTASQADDALPGRIYLTGGGSLLPGLAPALASIESGFDLRFQHAVETELLGRRIGNRIPDRPLLLDLPPSPARDVLTPVLSLAACVLAGKK